MSVLQLYRRIQQSSFNVIATGAQRSRVRGCLAFRDFRCVFEGVSVSGDAFFFANVISGVDRGLVVLSDVRYGLLGGGAAGRKR